MAESQRGGALSVPSFSFSPSLQIVGFFTLALFMCVMLMCGRNLARLIRFSLRTKRLAFAGGFPRKRAPFRLPDLARFRRITVRSRSLGRFIERSTAWRWDL